MLRGKNGLKQKEFLAYLVHWLLTVTEKISTTVTV